MKSPFCFIVEPKGDRYNNNKKIGNKNLLLNTEIYNHEFINRIAIVKSIPLAYKTDIEVGNEVLIHHNVFRRWHDIKGREKNSRSFIDEKTYAIELDQIFMYKKNNVWSPMPGYLFVQPVKNDWKHSVNPEKPLVGKVVYGNSDIKEGDIVGFSPGDEYEFVIDGVRVYRVMEKFITMKYENKGNEETYNPSWA